MDWSAWKRAPEKVRGTLTKLSDNSVVTSTGCKIYIPKRFAEKQLASIATETYIVGIFAMVVGDKFYSVSTINAMMRINPSSIRTTKFEDEGYLEFTFEPGSVVFADTQLIRTDTLVYKIFDMIISKGHVPWFMDYEDLAKLHASSGRFAGVNLGGSHAILAMFAAAIARDPVDRSKYYRHTVQSQQDAIDRPPAIIPLRSISHGATNTTSKLLGSNFDQGLTSALLNPSGTTERIEELLRR